MARANGVPPDSDALEHLYQSLTPERALANIEALIALPRTGLVGELEGFLATYREVAGDFPVRGNLVTDAHLATILRQHGVRTLYTNDRDFLRFDFLEVRNPLE